MGLIDKILQELKLFERRVELYNEHIKRQLQVRRLEQVFDNQINDG
jgi:hypothetical protein